MQTVSQKYKNLILRILSSKNAKRKVVTIVVLFTVFAYVLVPLGLVVNEFFPKAKTQTLYLSAELPAGSKLADTNTESLKILNSIRTIPGIQYVSAQVGQAIDPSGQSFQSGDNLVLFILVLPRNKEQKISSINIAKQLRQKFASYEKAIISVFEPSGGPPAGADIQIQVLGEDLALLDTYADKLISYLKSQPGIVNANKSIKPGVSKLTFVPDATKINEAGLNLDTIGLSLRMFTSGFTFNTVKFNDKSQDIVFRFNIENPTPESLSTLQVQTPQGNMPILSLGKFELKTNPTRITRHDGSRTITVTAGVTKGFSITQASSRLEKFADSLKLPEGYSWKTGGVNEENQKSLNSIFQAMIISAILIFGTMVIQFSSYRQAILVMLMIPIAISGVFIIFALTGTPLSFPALIGVLSLFGIVVTHAMILVDKINLNRKAGLAFSEAIADAGAARLEPIFLGSLVTILGLIPISLANALWRGLGGAIIAGLTFSGAIMLVFIPIVYSIWFEEEEKRNT